MILLLRNTNATVLNDVQSFRSMKYRFDDSQQRGESRNVK